MESLWQKFKRKGFSLKTVEQAEATSQNGNQLRKALTAFDLVLFGVGTIVGSGVFVLTGQAAKEYAGPAVIVSYLIASLAALFSALCYAEFAADIPVSGTAFNYMFAVYGEFMACVSKGFTSYFATLLGLRADAFIITFDEAPYIILDIGAFLLIAVLTIILVVGIKESAMFNNVVTGINVFTIVFILCFTFPFFKAENLTPFSPFGTKGMFHAASVVFFSYVGFDAVATMAEEVRNPKRDLPIGIVGSMLICTAMYGGMSLAIVGVMSYQDIDPNAAFSVAFTHLGYPWVSKIVSSGAVAGIVTSLFTTLLGQSRIFMVLGRSKLLPAFLESVHPVTQTPINATLITFTLSAAPALLLDLAVLADMVSIGTLFVLCLVCSAILWRRHCLPEKPESKVTVTILLFVVVAASLGEGLTSNLEGPLWLQMGFLAIWLLATCSFLPLPVVYTSTQFNAPFKPLVPSLGMLMTIHLMLSLGAPSYIRFGVWQVFGIIVYFAYSIHNSPDYSEPIQTPLLEEHGDQQLDQE